MQIITLYRGVFWGFVKKWWIKFIEKIIKNKKKWKKCVRREKKKCVYDSFSMQNFLSRSPKFVKNFQ